MFYSFGLVQAFFSMSRERWCKPAESWFCTFLLPCRFLSGASLGKIKGRGRPWGEGLAENTNAHTHTRTGITSPKHIEMSAVWCCLHVIKPLPLNRLRLMTLLVCISSVLQCSPPPTLTLFSPPLWQMPQMTVSTRITLMFRATLCFVRLPETDINPLFLL